MGLSTLLVGLSVVVTDRASRVMRWMLILHGVFFPVGVILPLTSAFVSASDAWTDGGKWLLFGWCVYFAPIMALCARFFLRTPDPSIVD